MAENIAAINLAPGLKADRKLEMIFVNMGTSETAEWEILGRGVEEASVAFNHDTNQATDILGITDTVVSPAKPEFDLDPCTIRGGQKLSLRSCMCIATWEPRLHSPPNCIRTAPLCRRASEAAPMWICP